MRTVKQVREWETILRSSTGVEFSASVTAAVVVDSEGHISGLNWIIGDLTPGIEAAEALQESEERYRAIFEHSPLGITHFDENGKVIGCNRQFLNIVGAPAEKVIGFDMFQDLEDPAMREAFLTALSGRIGYYEGDYRSVTGGRTTPLRVFYSRLTAEDGRLLGTVGIWEDITDRKLAEEELRESEERYRVLFEHSPLGILQLDPKGNVISYNRQLLEILGLTGEQIKGFNLLRSLRDDDMRAAVEGALSGGIGQYEGVFHSAVTDKGIPLRVLYGRISDEDGKSLGVVGIVEDITERTQAEAARRELSRQRLQASNVVAHELRNSLIKIGFVFPAINSVMSFLREEWELESRKVLSDQENKNALLMRLGELLLMGQPNLNSGKELTQVSEELLAEQIVVANAFFLPQHGEAWLENKIRPKWHRLLSESNAWDAYKEEVEQLLSLLERAIGITTTEEFSKRMVHIPEDLRAPWQKLAYTEYSTANLGLLVDAQRLLDHPELRIKHKQQLGRLLVSLKALADITSLIEDRMNRMLLSLQSGEELEEG